MLGRGVKNGCVLFPRGDCQLVLEEGREGPPASVWLLGGGGGVREAGPFERAWGQGGHEGGGGEGGGGGRGGGGKGGGKREGEDGGVSGALFLLLLLLLLPLLFVLLLLLLYRHSGTAITAAAVAASACMSVVIRDGKHDRGSPRSI